MQLVIMGPPGAGKGTQATLIAEHYAIPAISTGDMFRAMKTANTPLARQVREIMESGGYVSDEITNAIVADRLGHSDCKSGFLLDGYPRTLQQVQTLDDYLAETIRVRLQVYAEQTAPLLDVYRSRGVLVEVDGHGEVQEVSKRIFAALEARGERRAAELV